MRTSQHETLTHWTRLRPLRPDLARTAITTLDPGRRRPPSPAETDLRAALRRLPPTQRAAIVLRYFDDLSESETAAMLGWTTATVSNLVDRALASLRAAGLLAEGAATRGPTMCGRASGAPLIGVRHG